MSTNPFYVGTKVEDPKEFFGRVTEVRSIIEKLATNTPTSVSVVGETQIGSSSLLSYVAKKGWEVHPIASKEETDHWTQILADYDLHSFDMALFHDPKHFFTAMLNTLGTTGNTAHDLNIALEARQRKVVFFLDEFDATVNNPNFTADFFTNLRSVADKSKIALVVATKTSIPQLISDGKIKTNSTSPFNTIIGPTIWLEPLSDKEAYELLKGLAALGGYTLTTEELEFIVKEGKGYPRHLRQLGRIVIEKRQQGQKPANLAEVKKQFAQEMQLRKPRRKIPWQPISTITASIVLSLIALFIYLDVIKREWTIGIIILPIVVGLATNWIYDLWRKSQKS